jgi:hypothetical protein
MENKMDNFEKTVELYKIMNARYVSDSEQTLADIKAYESALDEYGFMDSQIVDECWSY